MLSEAVYKAYETDSGIKEKVEDELLHMLKRTDYDVYIVVLYVMSQLFKEKNNLSPFTMNMSNIVPELRGETAKRRKNPDGSVSKNTWDEINRFRGIMKREYGVRI